MKLTFTPKDLLSFALFLLFAWNTSAQVLINEYSAANQDDHFDNFNDNSDWIELYNAGSSSVSLDGYFLSDNINELDKWPFPNGVSIAPGAHLLLYASNRNSTTNTSNLHTNFKITQSKQEYIVLVDPSNTIVDVIQMTIPNQRNHSRGRMTDGSSDWGVFLNPSPGTSNSNAKKEYASRPVFDVDPGFYQGSVTVGMFSPNDTEIRYTTDGTDPSGNAMIYTAPITLSSTTTIKARTFSDDPDVPDSFMETNTYFINEQHTLPVFSISSDDIENLLGGSGGTQPITHLEYFAEDQSMAFEMTGHFRGHGNDSWGLPQRGIRFYVKDYYGYANKIDYPLFPTSSRTDFDVVILKASASDNYPGSATQWGRPSCHLRDAYVQSFSDINNLNLDPRRYRRCIMYVNGEYWGIYELRERIDSDYTKFYYDQGEKWVDMLEYWGGLEARYGGPADWNALHDFMLNNDLSIPANFDYVRSELDLSSLIDYVILNTFVVNTDWLNWNTKWWRGRKGEGTKWRYCLWDMDNIFNLGQNFTGLSTTTWQSDPCDVDNNYGNIDNPEIGHIEMLVALFENEEFVHMYFNRYADLASTVFSCENMLSYLDEMVAEIQPEMQRQIDRWGGTYSDWEENLQEMREEIENKCIVITDQLVDCYSDEGIMGPYDLEVRVEPPLSGKVQINSALGENYPWQATYFGGIDIGLTALPETGWQFAYWEVANNVFGPNQFAAAINMSMAMNDTITAHFTGGCTADPQLTGPELMCEGETVVLQAGLGFSTYLWSDQSTDDHLEITMPGVYSVTVVDDNGCPGFGEWTVNAHLSPLLSIEGSPSFCSGGTALLDAGPGFVNYLWSNNANSQTIAPSLGGTYTVTVTDEFGCTKQSSVEVIEIDEVAVSISGVTLLCEGATGSLNAGAGFATYQWSTGGQSQLLNIGGPGTYTVTVTDMLGCTGTDQLSVQALPAINTEEMLDLCYGDAYNGTAYFSSTSITEQYVSYQGCDSTHLIYLEVAPDLLIDFNSSSGCGLLGTIQAEVQGGNGNYSYQWSTGSTGDQIVNLPNGNYQLTVTDQAGCSQIASETIVLEPGIVIDFDTETVTCAGMMDGWIDLEILAGTPPYNIDWSNGASGNYLENLAAGIYTVAISDAEGCNLTTSIVIAEPETFSVDIETTLASGGNDGTATAVADGGTAPYTYQWNTGAQSVFITDLVPATYTVTVTDANGCTTVDEAIVSLTSTEEIALLNDLSILPNPADEYLMVEMNLRQSTEVQLRMMDISGKVVRMAEQNGTLIYFNVDVRNLPAGTYILLADLAEHRLVRRIVIHH
ncbi:MAG: CotH kinase family protein [Bacteroidota bacterium]